MKPTEVRCAFKLNVKKRIHYTLMVQRFSHSKRDQGLRAVSSWRREMGQKERMFFVWHTDIFLRLVTGVKIHNAILPTKSVKRDM